MSLPVNPARVFGVARALGIACAVLAALALLVATDRATSAWIVSLHAPALDPVIDEIAHFGSTGLTAWIAGTLLALGVALDRRPWRRLALHLLGALALSALVVVAIKPFIGRQEEWFQGPPNADASWWELHWGRFPSTHAALAFCAAWLLGCARPALRWPLLLLAVVAGTARVYQGAHLLSDVFAGAVIGVLVARLAHRRMRRATATALQEAPALSTTVRALAALALLVLPLFYLRLGAWGFFDPDEGRYAEIPREMLARGDLVTPTLNGVLYFEKPPLLYWLVAAAYRLFGFHELAARLVPALSATAGVLVAWRLGRRMFGERAGLLGAAILASNLFWAYMARELVIDMLFSALLFLALALWWCGHLAPGRRAAAWYAGFWATLGFAVLAKGPVAIVLVAGTLGLYALATRRFSALRSVALLATAPLLVFVAAPWFVLVARANPDFNHFFWYEQHVERFLGSAGSGFHDQPFWYLAVFLPLLFFPWSVFVPAAMAGGVRSLLPATTERRRAAVFLLGGALVVTLFFSASSGKLLPYVLPVMPLLALPLGAWFDRQLDRGAAAWRVPLRVAAAGAIAALLALAAAALVLGPPALRRYEDRGPGLAVLLAVPLLATAVAAWIALRRRHLAALLASLALGMSLTVVGAAAVARQVGPNHTCQMLVRFAQPGLKAGGELVTYNGYLPGLCYYARRRVVVNGGPGELQFGSERLPPELREQWFPDSLDVLRRQLASEAPTYCVVKDHDAAGALLPRLGPGVQELAWNKRRSMLGNAAAAALTPAVGRISSTASLGGTESER